MPKTKSSQEIREAAETTYRWHKKIEKQLCGKKIKSVRTQAISWYKVDPDPPSASSLK